ncbi:hypothetical protein QJS10_CPB11g01545 [Acorus calamus]|uniref:Uncharacterized protein n=1 Tax=Acorus calamus TaxID=4465 RepID=A0AAV9DQT5_ACOCL|nr:hypothetical protein QJS10_CPB11g01545 [Acorus calamus]
MRRSNEDQDAWIYDMEGCMRSRSRPSFYAPSVDESHGQGVRAPKGYVPVIVGRGREEETVFMVHTKLFNHPSFVAMLEGASEENERWPMYLHFRADPYTPKKCNGLHPLVGRPRLMLVVPSFQERFDHLFYFNIKSVLDLQAGPISLGGK